MENEITTPVIIVGAGIAGLTAAWQLRKQGIDVLVLEANLEVGGRMCSIQQDDALIDCGAQFLSSAYTIIPQLIKEMKLSSEFLPTDELVGFVTKRDIVAFHPRKPWQLLASKTVVSLRRNSGNRLA
jgi:protoporphyrinogen/coproporphyrinogen III oxidase